MSSPELNEALTSLRIDRSRSAAPAPGQRRLRVWPGWLAAAALSAAVAGLWLSRGSGARAARPPVATVHAVEVGAGAAGASSAPILVASGRIAPAKEAVLSPRVPGRLAAIYFKERELVEQGTVVARLEDSEARAQLLRSRASVNRARVVLEEQQRLSRLAGDLARAGAGNRTDADAALARASMAEVELQVAQAEVKLAESILEGLVIRAPFRGTVLRRLAEPGEAVVPAVVPHGAVEAPGAVITFADLSALEAEVEVNEIHLAKLKVGQPAEVELNAYPGRRLAGELALIEPVADRAKGSVTVRVRLAGQDPDLRPQLSAQVRFLQDARTEPKPLGLSVPLGAVKRIPSGQAVVFELREGRAVSRPVVLGEERDGRVAVRSGVSAREVLFANPPADLTDGDTIEVQP